ncbi:MAG: hypothetical protein ABH816_00130 [Candidatus Levyibacteriota bacterium]
MASLHSLTEEAKTIIKWGTILLFVFFIFLIIFKAVGGDIKEYFFPTAPTVEFGKLPKISFPQNTTNKKFTYSLDTVSGKLPDFPYLINIYKTIPSVSSLLSLKNAQERISKIGFISQGIALSNTLYKWENNKGENLVLDIVSNNFDFSSNFLYDQTVLQAKNLPSNDKAITKATSFLDSVSSFPKDIDISKTKTTFLSIDNSKLIAASSFSTAKIIRVDFFQKDINSLPIIYPNPMQSIISVFVGSGINEENVVAVNFFHQDVSETYATYPIKTADDAFLELKDGKAYIASYFGNGNEILINNIFLGYYSNNELQNYLMPIIVFTGDNGFTAYLSAVGDVWISNQ